MFSRVFYCDDCIRLMNKEKEQKLTLKVTGHKLEHKCIVLPDIILDHDPDDKLGRIKPDPNCPRLR